MKDDDELQTEPEPVSSPAPSLSQDGSTRTVYRAEVGSEDRQKIGIRLISAKVHQRLFGQASGAPRLGRFVVLETIGRGGMGAVYAAYDEELDRKVAVKVLLEDELPEKTDRVRFRREAQALARLSHPNVVTIHEVGETDEGWLFIAMEFVRGRSFAAWFRSSPPWEQVLEAFVQAGRGLAAAHAADLVHRDLKPHNIMRSEDGVVKVLDFGLARAADDEPLEQGSESVSLSSSALHSPLTRTGTVMGTPAYMSPEQHDGDATDARSDQYSFCVALWEGLAGARPIESNDLDELYRAKISDPPAWPSTAPSIPRRIVKAIQRGLSRDPADRWSSMDELLEVLTRNPSRRRRRWWLGLGGVGVLFASAALWTSSRPRNEPCTGAGDRLAGVWDEARSAEVESALLGVGKSYSAAVWERTRDQLETYADDWASMHTEACEATAVRREQSAQMLDLRMVCLQRAMVELEAVVDTLASADATVLENAHELTAGLLPLTRCADAEALLAEVEPPRAQEATAVETARRGLARARSLILAGRYDASRLAIEEAKAELVGVEYGPVRTELSLVEGRLLNFLGEYEASIEALELALTLATQWKQRSSMLDATLDLLRLIGSNEQSAEALYYWPLAEGLSRGQPLREARARLALAEVLTDQGQLAEAEGEFRTVLALRLDTLGPDHSDVCQARNRLAVVLVHQGRGKEAETELRATLECREARLGPDHPAIASILDALAGALNAQGLYDEAEAHLRTALSIKEKAFDSRHPGTARTRGNLASTLALNDKHEDAEREYRAALPVLVETLGPEHPRTAFHRISLALTQHRAGKHREAEAEARAARTILSKALGPQHPNVLLATVALGQILYSQKKLAEAETELRTIMPVLTEVLGPTHPHTWAAQHDLASILLELDRPAEALPLAEQLWDERTDVEMRPDDRASATLLLARILWTVEGPARDRDRAVELAEVALRQYEELGEPSASDAREAAQWLESHPRP